MILVGIYHIVLKLMILIRKFESFSHTEYNIDLYKNKEYLLRCIKDGKIF